MKKCLLCNKYNKLNEIGACLNCSKNPFNIERLRDQYAEKSDLKTFLACYNKKYKEIKDLNTSGFWDKKLKKVSLLSSQDGMTRSRVIKTLDYTPDKRQKVLDIGAGHGYLEELLTKHRKKTEIFGTDFSPESVKNLKSRFNGTFRVESIYNLNWQDNNFDVVYALEVLEHIKPTRIMPVLKSINRIIRKNGLFILSVPTNEGLENMRNNPSGHVRDYKLSIIKMELEISGFRVLDYNYSYAFKNFYTLKTMIAPYIKRWDYNNIVVKAQKI